MRLKMCLASACLLFLFVLFAPMPSFSSTPGAKDLLMQKDAKTLFDLSHAEVFSPIKEGKLNYSDFYSWLDKNGYKPGINFEPITKNALAGAKTYIIAGPMKEITDAEIDALKEFVQNGGSLLVLLHISRPAALLTETFGILTSAHVISEPSGTINNQSQDFFVTRFKKHPVTDGIKTLAVFGTWGLLSEGDAKTLASTSEKAWADVNRNRVFDKNEPVQEFGIVAAAVHGKGKVVVVADDAPFANMFLNEADNKKLARNIMKWFGK